MTSPFVLLIRAKNWFHKGRRFKGFLLMLKEADDDGTLILLIINTTIDILQ